MPKTFNTSATIMTIYTNDSEIENKIDTTAHNLIINETNHQYLESDKHYNIFAAELTAIQLAIKML